jgi:hypothetical protein
LSLEQQFFIRLQTRGLKGCFLKETKLPRVNGWLPSIEYVIVPLLPDQPSSNHKDFHEEGTCTILSSIVHHDMKVQIEVPGISNLPPTFSTERAGEEQMKGCFLSV